MRRYLFAAFAVLLVLVAAASFSAAETKTRGPYEIEVLDEDANTVRIVGYTLPKKDIGKTEIDLEIPAELGEFTVVEIGENAFIKQQRLHRVVIPEGVTAIGNKAFSSCDGIVSIQLPDTLVSIGDKAFSNCKALRGSVVSWAKRHTSTF